MEYQKRKHPRLKNYDYSLPGFYYITIHTESSAEVLSAVKQKNKTEAVVCLTAMGEIAEQQLLALENRYANIRIDKYVIMPNHIHAIIEIREAVEGCSLLGMVGAYKSLVTRICNMQFHTSGRKLFQTSFYERILRNHQGYQECWKYIDDNPIKWMLLKGNTNRTDSLNYAENFDS